MKKITLFVMAALTVSAMQAQSTITTKAEETKLAQSNPEMFAPVSTQSQTFAAPMLNDEETNFWDFEDEMAEDYSVPGGWTAIDADGDGYNWYHLNTGDAGFNTHSGTGHVTSASYAGGALTPDNWLVSPKVNLGGTFSFWAAGQDASWALEHFAVYVSTTDAAPECFQAISDEIVATADMTEYTFDLANYQGSEGYVAIRHYNVTDMFRLNVDDITISGAVTAINTVKSDAAVDNNYYNLMGQKMNANNLPAGIYIHNGKKVIVK